MATETYSTIELELSSVPQAQTAPPSRPPTLRSTRGENEVAQPEEPTTTRSRWLLVLTQLAGINFITSFSSGLVNIGLPNISESVALSSSLVIWPVSVYALTNSACLLLAGAIADIVGPRIVNLVGCFLISVFVLAVGFSRTGTEVIVCRALQGIAGALAIPTSVSIMTSLARGGKRRNYGFATLGLAQPLGYSFGLVLGGIFIAELDWRMGFYICGAASFALTLVGVWSLPKDPQHHLRLSRRERLLKEVDWVGAGRSSAALCLLSYALSVLSAQVELIRSPKVILTLAGSVAAAGGFVAWMAVQEKAGRPALIPNSVWRKRSFSSICVMVMLTNGVIFGLETYSNLYFQDVQGLSALGSSIRIIPATVAGIVINLMTGWLVAKIPAVYTLCIAAGLSTLSAVLMAVINPNWPYWYDAFFAQVLSPAAVDTMFTVGLLVISDVFPEQTQALAAAVFNTLAQVGTSVGLTVMSVAADSVTKNKILQHTPSKAALLAGYRASFWTQVALMATTCAIGMAGLRKLGKVGIKRE